MANRVREDRRDDARSRETEAASKSRQQDETPLKGTFASVMLLGAFLLASWVSVFILYVHRK